MIDEQEATGLGASDDADGNGPTCFDLSGELLLVEWVLLPLGLIGTFAVSYGDEGPVIWEKGELIEQG
jgi:hypothetical protein